MIFVCKLPDIGCHYSSLRIIFSRTAFELDATIKWKVFAIFDQLVCAKVVMILVYLPVYRMASSASGTVFLVGRRIATIIKTAASLQANVVSLMLTMSHCHMVSIICPIIQSRSTIFCWFISLRKVSVVMKVSFIWLYFPCPSTLVILNIIDDVAAALGMLEEPELSEAIVCWFQEALRSIDCPENGGSALVFKGQTRKGNVANTAMVLVWNLSASSFMWCSRITSISLL